MGAADRPRLTIRAASAHDAEAVARVWAAVLAEDRFFVTAPEEWSWTAEDVAQDLVRLDREACSRVFVALRGDQLLGVLWLRGGRLARLRHVARLELMVAAEARGQGLGRRLLREAVAWAEGEPGLRKISLAVMADNAAAIALYEGAGFRIEGRRVAEYQERDGSLRDDLLMARDVAG